MAYVNDPSQGSGLLGRILTAAAGTDPHLKRGNLIEDAAGPYSQLFKDYTASLGPQTAGLQDFTTQYKALTPQLAGLDQLHSSTLGDLVNKALNFNPTKYLQDTGNYYFGNLDKYLNTGLQAGTAAMNQARAAAGLGDRGANGYTSLLNANRITSNLLPAFNNAVDQSRLAGNQHNQDYFQNLAQIPNLQSLQTNTLLNTPYRALVPSQIQQGQIAGNLGLLNNLTQGDLANSYFYNHETGLQKWANAVSGLYGGIFDAADAANKVASAYGNVMTSGLGNIGGGKSAGVDEAPTTHPPTTGLGTPELPGQGTGENWSSPSSTFTPGPAGTFSYAPQYAGYGVGYGMPAANPYAPIYQPAYGGYGMGYSQNPYAQYGGFFS